MWWSSQAACRWNGRVNLRVGRARVASRRSRRSAPEARSPTDVQRWTRRVRSTCRSVRAWRRRGSHVACDRGAFLCLACTARSRDGDLARLADRGGHPSILERRARDGVVRRQIGDWLNAGVLESGSVSFATMGTPCAIRARPDLRKALESNLLGPPGHRWTCRVSSTVSWVDEVRVAATRVSSPASPRRVEPVCSVGALSTGEPPARVRAARTCKP